MRSTSSKTVSHHCVLPELRLRARSSQFYTGECRCRLIQCIQCDILRECAKAAEHARKPISTRRRPLGQDEKQDIAALISPSQPHATSQLHKESKRKKEELSLKTLSLSPENRATCGASQRSSRPFRYKHPHVRSPHLSSFYFLPQLSCRRRSGDKTEGLVGSWSGPGRAIGPGHRWPQHQSLSHVVSPLPE